jgi:very-short-patch-repair endonuclease
MRAKRNPAEPPERNIAELARRQHGVVAISQLLALGLTRGGVGRRLKTGRLHQLHAGVYAVGHKYLSQRALWMGAVLACGDGALLSHRSAGASWGMVDLPFARIDVTVPGRRNNGRRNGPRGIAIHRPRRLDDLDRAVRWGIPVTNPSRTLLDLASVVSRTQLQRAFEEAERLDLLDRARLAHLCSRTSGRRGTGALRALLAARSLPLAATRSELERQFLRFCRDRGLPIPAVNVPLAGYVVDCLWREERLVVELDSWSHHGDRESFEADRRRDARIQRAGHRIVRVTSRRMLHEPDPLEDELRALLGLTGSAPD